MEGVGNTAVGYRALQNVSQSLNNYGIAMGYDALRSGGSNNDIAIGYQALLEGNKGPFGTSKNIAIGYNAMQGGINSDGGNNIAIGTSALSTLLGNVSNNIAIGNLAGSIVSGGSNNVLLGASAGSTITTGTGNVILGSYAGKSATQNNNIAISDGAGTLRMFVTGSTGFVGVNTNSPAFQLQVNGTLGATLSTNSDGAYLVAHNSSTKEVQYTPQIAIDDNAFNPSGSGVAANNTWLVSADGYSIDSQVYNGYFSATLSGAPGSYTLFTIPTGSYASIWFEYTYAENSYTNMKTQTFVSHWNNSSTIEFTNYGADDIGGGTSGYVVATIVGGNTVVTISHGGATSPIIFGTYRLIKKI